MPVSSSLAKDNNLSSTGSLKAGQFSSLKGTPSDLVEGRPLPSNQDAEQGLLAACILDTSGEILGRCLEQSIGSDHFYHHKHQLIFEALLGLSLIHI